MSDIVSDARLDDDIRFPHPVSPHALQPRSVFITGATGLVASYLLNSLLTDTEAVIHCLVRGAGTADAEARLAKHLAGCGLAQGELGGRIRVIAGDLLEPRFGMSEKAFTELAGEVDVIHHSAGWLNMAYPYSRLKPVNVTGTREILRFAGIGKTKPVHYLSSMVVFFSDAHVDDPVLRETDTPLYDASLKGGYSKTKWVADRLVAEAQQRGLPACIYRPVRIMGHSKTGATNDLNDILPVLLKGCILLGKFPALDIRVTMVPVDYVTEAIQHLSTQASAWGKAYHFFHPSPVLWKDLMRMIQDQGYDLEEVPYDQWWAALKVGIRDSDGPMKKFLAAVLMVMTAPHFLFYKRPTLDASQLTRDLAGTGIECPPIDQALIETYLSHWQESGFVPRPTGPAAKREVA